jgi:hypothetical protein
VKQNQPVRKENDVKKHILKLKQQLDTGEAEQKAVMESYRKREFVRFPFEENALNKFFSPNRVPKGLTRRMVRECIDNQPLREWCSQEYLRLFGDRIRLHKNVVSAPLPNSKYLAGTNLPDEFLPDRGRMTSKRFDIGMLKFKGWADRILIDSKNRTVEKIFP